MPVEHVRFDRLWPARRRAWRAHYIAKGASVQKAERLATLKRNKASWPQFQKESEHG